MVFSRIKDVALVSLLAFVGCGGGTSGSTKKQPMSPKTSAAKTTLASKKTPPMSATMGTTVGGAGKIPMVTAKSPGLSWSEMADLTGSSTPVMVTFLYDATDDIVYAYAPMVGFACDDGTTGSGDILVILNKDGTGSVVFGVASGQCGGTADVVFGCDFGADGNATTCGACVSNASGFVCTTSA